jgi:hypothetical protein
MDFDRVGIFVQVGIFLFLEELEVGTMIFMMLLLDKNWTSLIEVYLEICIMRKEKHMVVIYVT